MKNITTLIQEVFNNKDISLYNKPIHISWSGNATKIFDWCLKQENVLVDTVVEQLDSMADTYFKANPRKRSYEIGTNIFINLDIPINMDPVLKELYNELDRMGAGHWLYEMSRKSVGTIRFVYKNDKKEHTYKPSKYFIRFKNDKELGNGYNDLPGNIITDLRERVLKCFNEIKPHASISISNNVNLYVKLAPAYDASAIKKITADIKGDRTYDDYRSRLDATRSGINKYYKEKGSSGYTGD